PKLEVIFPPLFDPRAFLQKEKKVNRHHDQTKEESGHAEKSADTFLHDIPNFFRHRGQIPLQVRNNLLGFRFKLLPLSRTDFSGGRRDCFDRRRRCFRRWRGRSRSRSWRGWARRWRSKQKIYQARRPRFPATSGATGHAIVLNDKIDNAIARFLGVTGKLAREVRALH